MSGAQLSSAESAAPKWPSPLQSDERRYERKIDQKNEATKRISIRKMKVQKEDRSEERSYENNID